MAAKSGAILLEDFPMLIGSILLILALALLVVLLARLANGRPSAFERWATTGAAVGLLMTGGGILAANLVESITGSDQSRQSDANSADFGKGDSSDPIGDQERQGAAWLHRDAVGVFVGRPGNGGQRMEPSPLEEELIKPSHSTSSQVAGLKSQLLKSAVAAKNTNRIAHYAFRDYLENSFRFAPSNTESWKLRNVQLVGLVKNPAAVVYETRQVPGMKDLKEIPTRELDAFEKIALAALQSGEDLKIEKHGKQIRMMGPIFAGNRCVVCHEQHGQMLGAFTYVLDLVPGTMPVAP